MEMLNSSDDLEYIIRECIDDGWLYTPDPEKLRIEFRNSSIIRSVRLKSLKRLSKVLKNDINEYCGCRIV